MMRIGELHVLANAPGKFGPGRSPLSRDTKPESRSHTDVFVDRTNPLGHSPASSRHTNPSNEASSPRGFSENRDRCPVKRSIVMAVRLDAEHPSLCSIAEERTLPYFRVTQPTLSVM